MPIVKLFLLLKLPIFYPTLDEEFFSPMLKNVSKLYNIPDPSKLCVA